MELPLRKQQILSAIVESYIKTGEPVGSKTLRNIWFSDVSPATVRNDMAFLTYNGYLSQPHTSAGRVPSMQGYRYYIDRLMQRKPVPERVQAYIDRNLKDYADTPENILKRSSKILSDVTDLISITSTPSGEDTSIQSVRFVQTGRYTAMAIIITSTGVVKSKLFRSEYLINSDILKIFDNALNSRFSGLKLMELTQPMIQSTAASLGELSLYMPSALMAVKEAAMSAGYVDININGQQKLLLTHDIDLDIAANILRFLNDTQGVVTLLHDTENLGTKILIGEESNWTELMSSSLIISKYKIAGHIAGALALLGPLRMDYASLIGMLEYVSEIVGNLIDEII